jgi:hypothetical protein
MSLEGCAFDKPDQFAALHHAQFQFNGGELMTDKRIFAPAVTLRYLKLIIHEGWNTFSAVSRYGRLLRDSTPCVHQQGLFSRPSTLRSYTFRIP